MIISRLPRFYSYHKSVSLETTYFEGKTDTCQLCKKDKRTGKDFFFPSSSSKTHETRKFVNAL